MKHCPFCGAQLEESARFCLYCMTSLDEKVTVGATAPKTKRWQGFLAAALVFSILLVTVWAIWQGVPTEPQEAEPVFGGTPTTSATTTFATVTTAETVAVTTSMATTSTETTASTTATTTTTTTAQVVPFSTGSSAATATTTVKPTTTTTNPTATTTKRATTTTKLTTSTTKQTITTTTRITTTVQTTTTKKPYTNVTETFTAPTLPAGATIAQNPDWFSEGDVVHPVEISHPYEEVKDRNVIVTDVVTYCVYNSQKKQDEYFLMVTIYNPNPDCWIQWWDVLVAVRSTEEMIESPEIYTNKTVDPLGYATEIVQIDDVRNVPNESLWYEISIQMIGCWV